MVTQRDYSEELVKAARSVLLELVHLLGEYWNHIVLVGGWVPEILLGSKESPHMEVFTLIWPSITASSEMKDISRLKNYWLREDTCRESIHLFLNGR